MLSRVQLMDNGLYRAQFKRWWVPFWWFNLTHAGQYADTNETAYFTSEQEANAALRQFAFELEPVKQPKAKPVSTTQFRINPAEEAAAEQKPVVTHLSQRGYTQTVDVPYYNDTADDDETELPVVRKGAPTIEITQVVHGNDWVDRDVVTDDGVRYED